MTYNELIEYLHRCYKEQLEGDVCVYIADLDEFYPIASLKRASSKNDVLDEGNLYLSTSVETLDAPEDECITIDR